MTTTELHTPEDLDAAAASEERTARALLRSLIDGVPAERLDALLATLDAFTGGDLPARAAVTLHNVGDPDAQAVITAKYPELLYKVEVTPSDGCANTVTHTWTCITGARVVYRQGPDGSIVVENAGMYRRHLWDDLVGIITKQSMLHKVGDRSDQAVHEEPAPAH